MKQHAILYGALIFVIGNILSLSVEMNSYEIRSYLQATFKLPPSYIQATSKVVSSDIEVVSEAFEGFSSI